MSANRTNRREAVDLAIRGCTTMDKGAEASTIVAQAKVLEAYLSGDDEAKPVVWPESTPVQRALPLYHSVKTVGAAKIVDLNGPDMTVGVDDGSGKPLMWAKVPDGWFDKHQPFKGGYLVIYADGYLSFSPPDTFEAGYIPVADQAEAR